MLLPLGQMPWTPDQAAFGNPGLSTLVNAYPAQGHYRPILAPLQMAQQTVPGSSWRGLYGAVRPDGTQNLFASGDLRLYRIDGKSAPIVDVSRGGADYLMQPADRWRMVQYNNLLIATNFRDQIQAYDLKAGGPTFGDLQPGGSGVAAAPRARYIAVVRDFVCVASTFDDADGEVGNRVRWHGVVDGLPTPISWDILPQTQADFQDIPNIGLITGYTGGVYGTILAERGIAVQQFNSSYLWSFDVVERQIGCDTPGSVVQMGQVTYFLSPQGWYAFNGQATPIGRDRIDRTFLADFDRAQAANMWSAVDTERGLVFWAYPGQGNTNGKPNRLLIFNPAIAQWGIANLEVNVLGPALQYGLDLNDANDFPDLNSDTRDLNDPRFWLQEPRFGCIDGGQVKAFTGDPLPATFEGAEMELFEGRRAVLQRAIPMLEGDSATLRVGVREASVRDLAYSGDHPLQADGSFRIREVGRYHRARLTVSGNWDKMSGLELAGTQLGMR